MNPKSKPFRPRANETETWSNKAKPKSFAKPSFGFGHPWFCCTNLEVACLAAVGRARVVEEHVPGGVHLDPPAPDTLGGGDLPMGQDPIFPLQEGNSAGAAT